MDNVFDTTAFNELEKPLADDWNQAQTQIYNSIRTLAGALFSGRSSDTSDSSTPVNGFVSDGFKVRPKSPVTGQVVITAGLGFMNDSGSVPTSIGGLPGLNDLAAYKPIWLPVDETITVQPATPGLNRYDIIEVKYDRRLENSLSRFLLNTTTEDFDPALLLKTLAFATGTAAGRAPSVNGTAAINYKTGTPGASPSEPSTSSGYVKIASIYVADPATTFDADVIIDYRRMLFPGGVCSLGMELSMVSQTATAAPTVTGIVAPPGAIMVAVGNNYVNAQCSIFVILGNTPSALSASVSAISNGAAVGTAHIAGFSVLSTLSTTINNTTKAAIAGANSSQPGLKVAVGQPCWRFDLIGHRVLNGGTVDDTLPNPYRYQFVASARS